MLNLGTRSSEREHMDDPGFQGDDLLESLTFIRLVNLLGGGQQAVKCALPAILKSWPPERPLEILDVGCGLGDIGAGLLSWGRKRGYDLRYLGLEQSAPTLALARARARDRNLRFLQGDLFDEAIPKADVVIASMVLHHFADADVIKAIAHLARKARQALIINDLERSPAAYAICLLLTRFLRSQKSRDDALLSIRKGFTREELTALLRQAGTPGRVRQAIGWRLVAVVPTGSATLPR